MPQFVKENASISVIVPAYNAEKYLQKALNSIYEQSFGGTIEIIAVNDGSTDATLEILKAQSQPLKIITQENKGVVDSRKAGLDLACGDFVAVLDADDLYLPKKLERQHNFLTSNSQFQCVFCNVEQFISPDVEKAKYLEIPEPYRIIPSMNFQGGLFFRSLIKEIPLSPGVNIRNGEFLEWFTRVREAKIKYEIINEVLVKRRVHDTNLGILKKEEEYSDYLKIIRAKLLRERNK